MMVTQDEVNGAVSAAMGWAGILRRHADEVDKAASSDVPEKWITDKRGWDTLRDQLNEAAGVMEGMASLVTTLRAMDQVIIAPDEQKANIHT